MKNISSAEALAALIGQGGIGPVWEGVEAKHEVAVGVEGEDGGGDADEVEDGPHAHHVLDGESPSRVDDGVGRSGDRQHEGVAGGEGDPQAEVGGVDVEAGGETQDHRDQHGGGGGVGGDGRDGGGYQAEEEEDHHRGED